MNSERDEPDVPRSWWKRGPWLVSDGFSDFPLFPAAAWIGQWVFVPSDPLVAVDRSQPAQDKLRVAEVGQQLSSHWVIAIENDEAALQGMS